VRESGVPVTEIRYERLVASTAETATELANVLGVAPADLTVALGGAHAESVGRWQRDLSPEQLAHVEAEAGDLL
jgi:hypothetical protein